VSPGCVGARTSGETVLPLEGGRKGSEGSASNEGTENVEQTILVQTENHQDAKKLLTSEGREATKKGERPLFFHYEERGEGARDLTT